MFSVHTRRRSVLRSVCLLWRLHEVMLWRGGSRLFWWLTFALGRLLFSLLGKWVVQAFICSGEDFLHRERMFVRQQGFPKRVGSVWSVVRRSLWWFHVGCIPNRLACNDHSIWVTTLVMVITRLLDHIASPRVSLAILCCCCIPHDHLISWLSG